MLDAVDGFLFGKRYLILDRDPVFTKSVRELLASGGVKTVRLPARSPNLQPGGGISRSSEFSDRTGSRSVRATGCATGPSGEAPPSNHVPEDRPAHS